MREIGVGRFALTVLAVWLCVQVLAFLIHAVLLADAYAHLSHVWRPAGDMQRLAWIPYLTSAVWCTLFVWAITRLRQRAGVGEGLRLGALLGLFLALPQAYDAYALYPVTPGLAHAWFISGLLSSMIAGAISALLLPPR